MSRAMDRVVFLNLSISWVLTEILMRLRQSFPTFVIK